MEDKTKGTQTETIQEIYNCIDDIVKVPDTADARLTDIEHILKHLKCQKRLDDLKDEELDANENREGETALHMAIRCFQFKKYEEKEVVKLLISEYPKLIIQDRSDTKYAGQTPLHMAVCKGNLWLVDTLLKKVSDKKKLLKRRADGVMFSNTVMMGELPLTIAALTFNKEIFDLLLKNGADLDEVNSLGDNVCHSLIRYAYLYPDKLDDVLAMCREINVDPAPDDTSQEATKSKKLRKKIWLMENREGLNPLQLAVSLGQHQIFTFIMNQEAYCSKNSKDGLFDITVYDVTEIDAISSMKTSEISGVNETVGDDVAPDNIQRKRFTPNIQPFRKSILMVLFDLEPSVAFQFVLFPPVMRVVNRKWNVYKWFFYPWWILHTIFMIFLTWYCVERAKQEPNTATGYDVNSAPVFAKEITKDAFVTSYGVISICVSILYISQEILRGVNKRMHWTFNSFSNPYSNGWFRLLFIVFALCLIIDFFVAIWSTHYENYLLILALILGWFLTIFCIGAIRLFSFFTIMIQNILINDMLRFFVVIGIEMLAFSTAMHMAIQGSDVVNDTDYQNFWQVLFSMFTLMVGAGDMAAIYNTRHPGLCIVILIGFIVMTTLLMVNALIAIMSRTCMELIENVGSISTRNRHWTLQMLSLILFLESILPSNFIFKVGTEEEVYRYNNAIHRRKMMKRYMLEIRSLQNEDRDEHEDEGISTSWGFRTTVLKALRNNQNTSKNGQLSGLRDEDDLKKWNKKKKRSDRSVGQEPTSEPSKQLPVQMQQPNPLARDNGYPSGSRSSIMPAELDIYWYQVSRCRNCAVEDTSTLRDFNH